MANYSRKLFKNTPFRWYREILLLGIISSFSWATPSLGAIANFDSLEKGFFGTTLTDGGITFSNLIAGSRQGPREFVVQSLNSPSNYLTFGGPIHRNRNRLPYFGAFGSLNMSTGQISNSVSLNVFTPSNLLQSDSSIVLEAFFQGKSVASTSMALSDFSKFRPSGRLSYTKLALSGIRFDELQLYTPSAFADGVIFIGLDNVRIDKMPEVADDLPVEIAATVPESQPLTILGILTASFLGYFSQKGILRKTQE